MFVHEVGAGAPVVLLHGSSANDVADAVLSTVRNRFGDEPFAIVGNSFGGMIARRIAHELRSQELGLATIAGAFAPEHAARILPESRAPADASNVCLLPHPIAHLQHQGVATTS